MAGWTQPSEALNAISLCVQASLSASGLGVPTAIVLGGAGVGNAYDCCAEGLLAIEWSSFVQRVERNSMSVRGAGTGDVAWRGNVIVRVARCAATYRDNRGNPVAPTDRTASSLSNLREGWRLLNDLACCAADNWRGYGVAVLDHTPLPVGGGCIGHNTTLSVELPLCCYAAGEGS